MKRARALLIQLTLLRQPARDACPSSARDSGRPGKAGFAGFRKDSIRVVPSAKRIGTEQIAPRRLTSIAFATGVAAGCFTVLAFAFAQMASAAPTTLFVATNATGDGSGLNWANATNSIQGAISAIDPSNPTNTVWVSNGVYEVGGVTNYPTGTVLTNRVAITNAITVRSANNDPTNTIIKGAWNDPLFQTNAMGPTAVRCVYMAANSSLIGFMLTNGATLATGVNNDKYGGGVHCPQITTPTISNCIISGNSAYSYGGGSYYGTLRNCTIISNYATAQGGGTYASTLFDCTLTNNWLKSGGGYGGGAYGGILSNCTIANGSAQYCGGVYKSTLYNCTLTRNTGDGGGAYESTLFNCTLSYNSGRMGTANCIMSNCTIVGNTATTFDGGGASGGTQYNCTLIDNSAPATKCGGATFNSIAYNCLMAGNSAKYGGGASSGTLYNCTIANNSASTSGGGVSSNKLYNCIVYFNNSPAGSNWNENDTTIVFTNSCTAPAPAAGSRNITGNPMFVDTNVANYRLIANSPCINTGTNGNWTTNSYDRDGRTRIRYGTVDMGAYETIYDGTIYILR